MAKTCFEKAKWAAGEIIDGKAGTYSIENNYRAIFSSKDLSSNKEVIFFRQYETAMTTHCLMSYVNREPQTGMSKNAFDAIFALTASRSNSHHCIIMPAMAGNGALKIPIRTGIPG